MWSLFCNLFGYSITICLNNTERRKKETHKTNHGFQSARFWEGKCSHCLTLFFVNACAETQKLYLSLNLDNDVPVAK